MSRVGKKPIEIPKGVEVKIAGSSISVKGPKGTLNRNIDREIKVAQKDGNITVERAGETKVIRAKHGLYRALIANMIKGVSEGFEIGLELVGVGYKAAKQGKNLSIQIGFSHPVVVEPPQGIEIGVEGANKIKVAGSDKELVGQVAADIRSIRAPEPYKQKGIRYAGERVRKKAGKVAKVGAAA